MTIVPRIPMFPGMWKATLGLVLGLTACSTPEPPEEIALDWNFSPEHRVLIGDAVDHWCNAVGWCPRIMGRGSVGAAPVRALSGAEYARLHRSEYSVGYNHSSRAVYFNMDLLAQFPELAWQVFAHELGHFGVDGHLGGAGLLMSWSNCLETAWVDGELRCNVSAAPMYCIDTASAKRFCHDVGWPTLECASTCVD